MSGGLVMPGKGKAAQLLSELNAEHAPKPDSNETHVTTLQRYNEPTTERTQVTTNEEQNVPAVEPTKLPSKKRADATTKVTAPARPNKPEAVDSDRESRLTKAIQIAADDEIAVVTVRVSAKLNKYLDDYVDRINRIEPKRKYRKQDAIAEAFAAFYADHIMPPAPIEEEL